MLSPFGTVIRSARIQTSTTLTQLANYLNVSVSFLSAVENGRKPVPSTWRGKAEKFFSQYGLHTDFSKEIALSSKQINLDGLPTQTANVLSRVSAVNFHKLSDDSVKEFLEFLNKLEEEQNK